MLTTWEETADDGGHDEEDDDDEEDDERTEDEKFLSEVTESIRRALEEGAVSRGGICVRAHGYGSEGAECS